MHPEKRSLFGNLRSTVKGPGFLFAGCLVPLRVEDEVHEFYPKIFRNKLYDMSRCK